MCCFRGSAGSAASLPTPDPVAGVSRVIGIFDSTAKAIGWQVWILASSGPGVTPGETTPNSTKRHSLEWRLAVLQWSLASAAYCGRQILSATPSASSPGRLILLIEERSRAVCSCRVPALHQAAFGGSAAVTSLALSIKQSAGRSEYIVFSISCPRFPDPHFLIMGGRKGENS